MNPWKLATGAALCAAAFTVTTAAGASSPAPPVTTLDPDVFVERFRCEPIEANYWTPGSEWLDRPRKIKTTVYRVPGDETALIRRGVNKATAAAVASVGDPRFVCLRKVQFSVRVRWS